MRISFKKNVIFYAESMAERTAKPYLLTKARPNCIFNMYN
jgi:hypothetical protein